MNLDYNKHLSKLRTLLAVDLDELLNLEEELEDSTAEDERSEIEKDMSNLLVSINGAIEGYCYKNTSGDWLGLSGDLFGDIIGLDLANRIEYYLGEDGGYFSIITAREYNDFLRRIKQ